MIIDRCVDQEWLIIVIINGLKLDIGVDVIQVDLRILEELRNVVIRFEVVERRCNNFIIIQENINFVFFNVL